MAKNNWNIKIAESENPKLRGFYVTVENNGEYIGGIKGIIPDFNRAIEEGKGLIISQIKRLQEKIKYAKQAQEIFTRQFLFNKMLDGVYGVGIHYDEKGLPYLNVLMNTDNEYLMKLIPDKILVPHTTFEYEIKKEKSDKIVAQSKK